MILILRYGVLGLAALSLLAPLSKAERVSKACHAVEGLTGHAACRLTECRNAGMTKVRLGQDQNSGVDVEGDLVLLDHVCDGKTSVSSIVTSQVELLKSHGFAVQGPSRIEDNAASVVLKKGSQWIELSALVLEGAPTLTVRSITPDRSPVEVASSQSSAIPFVSGKAGDDVSAVAKPAVGNGIPARLTGAMPLLPAGISAQGAEAKVTLELMVDEKGQIQKVFSAKGNAALVPAALNAVKTWTIEPAREQGVPVASAVTVVVEFKPRP